MLEILLSTSRLLYSSRPSRCYVRYPNELFTQKYVLKFKCGVSGIMIKLQPLDERGDDSQDSHYLEATNANANWFAKTVKLLSSTTMGPGYRPCLWLACHHG
jgi:hypothetical protein